MRPGEETGWHTDQWSNELDNQEDGFFFFLDSLALFGFFVVRINEENRTTLRPATSYRRKTSPIAWDWGERGGAVAAATPLITVTDHRNSSHINRYLGRYLGDARKRRPRRKEMLMWSGYHAQRQVSVSRRSLCPCNFYFYFFQTGRLLGSYNHINNRVVRTTTGILETFLRQ